MAAAANTIISKLNDEFKENNAVHFSEASSVVVIVPISSVKDWLEVKKRLDSAAFIKHYDLQAMRKDKVQLTVFFSRSLERLRSELAAGGLTLKQTGSGLWILYDSQNPKLGAEKTTQPETPAPEISVWGISDIKE